MDNYTILNESDLSSITDFKIAQNRSYDSVSFVTNCLPGNINSLEHVWSGHCSEVIMVQKLYFDTLLLDH